MIQKHISHLEDLVIEKGITGMLEAYQQVVAFQMRDEYPDAQDINLKVDGTMMLLFGSDPRQQFFGQFFVATKSGLNSGVQKLCHSDEEIEYYHKDPTLVKKLKSVLKYLKAAYGTTRHIYQCDVVFCLPEDVCIKKHYSASQDKDIEYVTFTPNVITYAYSDEELADRILDAQVGIIIHERLNGVVDDKGIVQFVTNTREVLNVNYSELFVRSSNLNHLMFEIASNEAIRDALVAAVAATNNISAEFNAEYLKRPAVIELLKQFMNQQVEDPKNSIYYAARFGTEADISDIPLRLNQFIHDAGNASLSELKTDAGKKARIAKYKGYRDFLNESPISVQSLFLATFHLTRLKYAIYDILTVAVDREIDWKFPHTFFCGEDGMLENTAHEGFVLFLKDSTVKIVDRLTFSRYNRMHNSRFKRKS